jgi:MOSC domain-containing protein YiiM
MRVLSVNVGLPREVTWRGKPVRTGIYKEPVTGRVPLRRLNLDGDRQADLRVHGGPDKAVYAYPSEYYELWSRERPELEFGPGTFGENLTTEGLLDEHVSIGDRFRFGTAELVVTQPRLPCFKLGIKMGRDAGLSQRATWRQRNAPSGGNHHGVPRTAPPRSAQHPAHDGPTRQARPDLDPRPPRWPQRAGDRAR